MLSLETQNLQNHYAHVMHNLVRLRLAIIYIVNIYITDA